MISKDDSYNCPDSTVDEDKDGDGQENICRESFEEGRLSV